MRNLLEAAIAARFEEQREAPLGQRNACVICLRVFTPLGKAGRLRSVCYRPECVRRQIRLRQEQRAYGRAVPRCKHCGNTLTPKGRKPKQGALLP